MAEAPEDRRARLDAEHARRLLAMLVTTSGRLAPVLDDWHVALGQVADDIVDAHADLFAVDIIDVDTGHPVRALWRAADHVAEPPAAWNKAVAAAISRGAPSLYPEVEPVREGARAPRTVLVAAADDLGLSSLAIVPVTTRGLTLGTLAVGTTEPRRGLRPSDVEAYLELAARLAMAIERVLLHREARAATRHAEDNARRLGRAAQAAPAIAASLNLDAVAEEAAAQVARVLDLRAALCEVDRTGNVPVTSHWPSTAGERVLAELRQAGRAARQRGHLWRNNASTIAIPLTDAVGNAVGYLAVSRHEGGAVTLDADPVRAASGLGFSPEEEAVLAVLGTATAAAAEHARLFSQTLANETRLRTVIAASPLAIVEIGSDGELLDSNPSAASLFGTGRDGESPAIGEDAATTLLSLRDELLAGVDVVDRQVTFPRIGASPVVARASGALIGNRSARDPALFFLVDVTQRLFLEREVQQARRMESLGRLAGGVAHDFNNLLTIITGYSNILERHLGGDHPQLESVHAIQAAAQRASTFTSQLLTISRRRIGREGAVDVNAVLRELMDVLPRLLTEAVKLTVEPEPGHLWVDIESGQLEQVLLNLVVNARNAMPDGGALAVRTAALDEPAGVLITVSDSGIGMDPATADHCFEPFFSGPDGPKGTGLGLATVYGIVEQAGGRITFDTERGVGTTFSITLPLAPAPELVTEDGAVGVSHNASTEGRAVLLVEDDPLIRSLADRVLTEAGCAVHSASSAEDAFEVAELLDDHIDLLVTDVVMPGIGGADLAAELSGRIEGLRVVFMSGFIDDLRRRKLVQTHPASVFLPKPFGPEELITAVSAAMSLDQGSKR